MPKAIDLDGNKYGRLVVFGSFVTDGKHRKWPCVCECGVSVWVRGDALRDGHTQSCGCLQKDAVTTHGMSFSPEHNTWDGMMARCYNQNTRTYKDYGGRGISVIARWHNFEGFLSDMGERPKEKTLDRIDNNGNYEPDNCRWATRTEQQRNQRVYRSSTTGVRGVQISPSGKYRAQITTNNKTTNLGIFPDLESAAEARKQAELKYWK